MVDIAVIGLGLRFPGDASSPEALWDILEHGESQWSEIPQDRLNINGYYHPGGDRQGSISFKGAHFIKGNIAEFDASFFSISAADAKAIDPQQRLLLEVCYEALENAGCTKEGIDGTDTSVYVGSFVKDYEQICLRDPDWQPQYAATGNGIAIMANRISYYFNLHGPSMTIDTGCSGSLVSVHLAVQSLLSGESSLAIAAGAGLILTPNTIMPMTALNFLSPDGKCFTFDARANGYGRGEGVGVVILKRLSDAIRDNDTVRAVIRGTRVNQDGRTTGITLPSKEAQVANIRAVYMAAGLPFSDTAYVECHGTGTQAGDWRELKAIAETLGASRASDNPLFVGSVKPNIGHLEGAAGVAGLIKAVLMLERERIPPHINFETPNPDIDFTKWKVQVSRIAQAWPFNQRKRISVNCFGFGGTNAHPATTAIQIAIVDLLHSFGITPDFVVGHSSGEIAAAYACGAISREEAWEVAYYRRLAASKLQSKIPGFQGAMIVVSMSFDQATSYISGLSDPLEIACINSSNSITLSGKREIVESAARDLTAKNVRHRVLSVDMAYHSTYMKKAEDEYILNISSISPSVGRKTVRMFSTVSGGELQCSSLNAGYWGKNMVSTVQFSSAIESLMGIPEDQHPSVFIEMGPSTVLRTLVLDTLATRVQPEQFFSALDRKRAGMASILNIVGELWSFGQNVNLKSAISRRLSQARPKCLSDLPSYPWNHTKSYWHESHLSIANRFREYGRLDLIGAPTADSVSFEPRWRGFLRISENPWIQDHQVQKTVIYPAAGMICMVLEGARQLRKRFSALIGYEIRNMRFEKAIVVPNTAHGIEIALNMRAEPDSGKQHSPTRHFTFSIYSKALGKEWEKHATGSLHFCCQSQNMDIVFAAFHDQHDEVSSGCTTSVNPRQLYEHLDTAGVSYGPMFRNILEVKKGSGCCISKIRVPDTRSKMPANFEHPHLLHPATLDSMFQTLFALDSSPKIPYQVQSIFVSDSLDLSTSREFVGHAIAKQLKFSEAEAHITMCSTDRPLSQIIIKGLCFSGDLFTSSAGSSFLPNYRNLATKMVWREDPRTAKFESLRHAISLLCHKHPSLSILQIGGELSLAKCALLAVLDNCDQPLRLGKYSFINQAQPSSSIEDIRLGPFRSYVEQLPDIASVRSEYDLILVNGSVTDELGQFECFLKPSGIIFQLCSAGDTVEKPKGNVSDTSFGLGCSLTDMQSEWLGCTGAPFAEIGEIMQASIRKIASHSTRRFMPSDFILLLPHDATEEISLFETQFREYLAANCPATSLSALQLRDAVRDGFIHSGAVYVSLLDLSPVNSTEGFIFGWNEVDFNAFHLLQSRVKTIIWITKGANMNPTAPRLAPIFGLARTLMSEDLQKTFATFDLAQDSLLSESKILDMLIAICQSVADPALGGEAREVDFAEQDGALLIPRLEPLNILNDIIEKGGSLDDIVERRFRTEASEIGRQILLESCLHSDDSSSRFASHSHFQEIEMGELDPRNIAISFESATLLVTNRERGAPTCQSHDVVGYVSATGNNTSEYKIGDKVVSLIPGGNGLCTTARVDAALVTHYRPGFVPSHFLSAYYALFDVGRACKGKEVLIHVGASGFGLAAVELALLSGASVMATVMGADTDRQREILKRRGIGHGRILDGNDDAYPSVVKLLTNDRGVDIVYNPTQKDVRLSVACARRYGTVVHFVDTSKSASVSNPSNPVTMVGFDLAALLTEDLDHAIAIFDSVNKLTAHNCLEWMSEPTLQHQFDISQLQNAMQVASETPNIGYGHVTAKGAPENANPVQVLQQKLPTSLKACIDENSTYILAGGLGGLGRSIAELLADNGAKHIAFFNRSGASSSGSMQFLQKLCEKGVTAKAFAVDICDQDALQDLVRAIVATSMPPIAGVFHCAAVIKDAVFDNMTYDDWNIAFKPKALGAHNLVEAVDATGHDPFYVFLASSAGVIGTRGQANYAAGNAFLDALAGSLRIRGKRATSLDLGPILGAGMLAEDEALLDILRASGFYGIRHEDFLTIVKHAITRETFKGKPLPPQVVIGVGTGGLMLQNQPADPYWSRTAMYSYLNIVDMPEPDLSTPTVSVAPGIKAELASCSDAETAADIVCSGLSGMLAKAMNMTAEELDPSRSPSAYGVDSLVAVGVRNWISGNCGVDISVFEILSDLSVFELSKLVVQNGKFGRRADAT
ncbi:Beta-ketoacyl synthase [Cordyceps javanica]|uniref:Beta-ketoacyl synthase n=1 Tax=Cordyceps javanica TaxID=43265 RepID=A0A545UVA5_9HYPO|nr:Beta-ketoacyl synthase [Cordyceps javanica]